MRALIAIVGVVLLAAGMALGFVPTTATVSIPGSVTSVARTDTYTCGSPWSADQESIDHEQGVATLAANVATVQGTPTVAADTKELCAAAFGTRGTWGAVLAGFG